MKIFFQFLAQRSTKTIRASRSVVAITVVKDVSQRKLNCMKHAGEREQLPLELPLNMCNHSILVASVCGSSITTYGFDAFFAVVFYKNFYELIC